MTGKNHVNPAVLEAIGIALEHGQGVFQIAGKDCPVDFIAFDTVGQTLITVIRSRTPLNDAHTALEDYYNQFFALVTTATEIPCNRALWFTSRPHGWVWYEATTGGIARMDAPFMPMIRYTYSGSAIPRSANHPIRVPENPESKIEAAIAPIQTPLQGGIPSRNRH